MHLLLPIKEYAEGPEEIRGRSGCYTRRVHFSYAEGPNIRTRKVHDHEGVATLCVKSVHTWARCKRTRRSESCGLAPLRRIAIQQRTRKVRFGQLVGFLPHIRGPSCTRKVRFSAGLFLYPPAVYAEGPLSAGSSVRKVEAAHPFFANVVGKKRLYRLVHPNSLFENVDPHLRP